MTENYTCRQPYKRMSLVVVSVIFILLMTSLVFADIPNATADSGDLSLTINNPTPATNDYFGISVATTPAGDLLVGAYADDTGASNAGSAYLFDGTDGSLLLTINNPTPATNDIFGFSVATTPAGDLLVGAYYDDTGASDAGSAYLFDGTDGSLLLTINNPTPVAGDYFGHSVATTPAGDLLVGAYADDTGASDAGSAYLFEGIHISPTPEQLAIAELQVQVIDLQNQITSVNGSVNTLDTQVSVMDTLVDYIDTFLNGIFLNYEP